MTTRDTLLKDLIDHVQSRMDDGETQADVAPETLKALAQAVASAPSRKSGPPAVSPSRPPSAAEARKRDDCGVVTRAAPATPSAPAAPPAAPVPRPETQSPAGDSLATVAGEVAQCTRCALHKTRTRTVPGQGRTHPEVMFVGEAPGQDEDRQGLAFVGRAGQLLTRMIEAMGYTREEVFIGNILKCRPPDNRKPLPEEMETCLPYLRRQIRLLQPKVIVALGATAVEGLLRLETGITKLRGRWFTFEGIPLMPTYHPAYLLRNPAAKRDVWADLQTVLKSLGRPIPPVKR
jgi:DNA polymerase